MAVTSIRQIDNNSTFRVLVLSQENGRNLALHPNESIGTDMWIPWCSSESDFGGLEDVIAIDDLVLGGGGGGGQWKKKITIFEWTPEQTLRPVFYLWQKDNQVSFSKHPQGFPEGQCVPLNCATGGNRRLRIRGTDASTASVEVTTLR